MNELLKTVDQWFLILAVCLLGGYFLWSVKRLFNGLEDTIEDLRELIDKVFEKHDDHERRLSALEGRCDAMHGPGGRRSYDPVVRTQQGPL